MRRARRLATAPRKWLAYASVAALMMACGASPAERAPTIAPAPASPRPTAALRPAPPSPVSEVDQRANELVALVLQRVSALRQLPALGPVRARVIDRATMLDQVQASVRSQIPPEAIRGESEFLKAFGFLPDAFDYEAGVYRLIRSQLAGYYDPDVRVMFLMDDLAQNDRETTLAHELVHALQDQHYRLGPKLAFEQDGNDQQAAIQSLAEGDATSAMLDYELAPDHRAVDISEDRLRAQMIASTGSSPELASFPYVLRASLVAPYVDGVLFVQRLRLRGGWSAVDAVWQNPPTTSEQILHLDKLDAREPADPVPVPSHGALGNQWEVSHTDVYGEQGLRIALEDWMAPGVAAGAAKGWAGDRAAVYRHRGPVGEESAAAWHIRFDPGAATASLDADAIEAFRAIASGWGPSASPVGVCRAVPSGRLLAMVRRGRDIAIVAGPPHRAHNAPGAEPPCSLESRWAAEIAAQR